MSEKYEIANRADIGHKYVSSTERYRTDNLEDLSKKLEKYNPLRDNQKRV